MFDRDEKWMIAAVISFIFLMATLGVVSHHNELMSECLADGHKKYECISMLRGN